MHNTSTAPIKMRGYIMKPNDLEAAAKHIAGTDLSEKNISFKIPENGYLSDSEQLKKCLEEFIASGGMKILLRAGCGYGKTYLFLEDLPRIMQGRHFIMLLPYILHTEQLGKPRTPDINGAVYQPAVVRASDASKNFFHTGRPVVATYDQAHSLLNILKLEHIPSEIEYKLQHTVLVIDEIHLKEEQKNLRHEALTNMELLAGLVKFYGGTVFYLTATPRKLCGYPFDMIINCQKYDKRGLPLPAINASEVTLLYYHQPSSHKYTFKQALLDLFRRLTDQGYFPLVRINSENKIKEYAAFLRDHDLQIRTLTAKDRLKGSADQEDSMYGVLTRHESLPYADAYMTTSWMDLGVNVTHRLDKEGHKYSNPKVVPIFLINRLEYDIDKIQQFFVRLRFKYEKAYVIMDTDNTESQTESESTNAAGPLVLSREQIESFLRQKFFNFNNLASTFNTEGRSRSDMIDSTGKTEHDGLVLCNGRWSADMQNLCADMMVESYKELFKSDISVIRDFLEKDLRVPVITEQLLPVKKKPSIHVGGTEVDDKILPVLEKALADPTSYVESDLIAPRGFQSKDNPTLSEINSMKGGHDFLETFRSLRVSDAYTTLDSAKLAIEMVSNGSATVSANASFPLPVYPIDIACDKAIRDLGSLSNVDAESIVHYILSREERSNSRDSLTDLPFNEDFLGRFKLLWDNNLAREKLKIIAYLYNSNYTNCSWHDLCAFFAENSLEYCKQYQIFAQCMFFNQYSRKTDENRYMHYVCPGSSIIGTAYDILRYPERYSVKLSIIADDHLHRVGSNGFKQLTITHACRLELAAQMNKLMRSALKDDSFKKPYYPEDLSIIIQCIYKVNSTNGSWYDRHDHERYQVRDVRSKIVNQLPGIPQKKSLEHQIDVVLMAKATYAPHNRRYAFNAVHSWIEACYGKDIADAICNNKLSQILNHSWRTGSDLPPEYRPGMMRIWLKEETGAD